jgi:hypothetical protein
MTSAVRHTPSKSGREPSADNTAMVATSSIAPTTSKDAGIFEYFVMAVSFVCAVGFLEVHSRLECPMPLASAQASSGVASPMASNGALGLCPLSERRGDEGCAILSLP